MRGVRSCMASVIAPGLGLVQEGHGHRNTVSRLCRCAASSCLSILESWRIDHSSESCHDVVHVSFARMLFSCTWRHGETGMNTEKTQRDKKERSDVISDTCGNPMTAKLRHNFFCRKDTCQSRISRHETGISQLSVLLGLYWPCPCHMHTCHTNQNVTSLDRHSVSARTTPLFS